VASHSEEYQKQFSDNNRLEINKTKRVKTSAKSHYLGSTFAFVMLWRPLDKVLLQKIAQKGVCSPTGVSIVCVSLIIYHSMLSTRAETSNKTKFNITGQNR